MSCRGHSGEYWAHLLNRRKYITQSTRTAIGFSRSKWSENYWVQYYKIVGSYNIECPLLTSILLCKAIKMFLLQQVKEKEGRVLEGDGRDWNMKLQNCCQWCLWDPSLSSAGAHPPCIAGVTDACPFIWRFTVRHGEKQSQGIRTIPTDDFIKQFLYPIAPSAKLRSILWG